MCAANTEYRLNRLPLSESRNMQVMVMNKFTPQTVLFTRCLDTGLSILIWGIAALQLNATRNIKVSN